MKTCGHVSSRDKKKKPAGSYFVMRAGLRNNEFCLHGQYVAEQGCIQKFCQGRANLGYGKKRGGGGS